MVHGDYRVIQFVVSANNSIFTKWMGRYLDSGRVEPTAAQQIRNWINTQNIWIIASDKKLFLSNDSLDALRLAGVIEGGLSIVQTKLGALVQPTALNVVVSVNVFHQGNAIATFQRVMSPIEFDKLQVLSVGKIAWSLINHGVTEIAPTIDFNGMTTLINNAIDAIPEPPPTTPPTNGGGSQEEPSPEPPTGNPLIVVRISFTDSRLSFFDLSLNASDESPLITASRNDARWNAVVTHTATGTANKTLPQLIQTITGLLATLPEPDTPDQVPSVPTKDIIPKVIAGLFMGGVALAFMKGIKK